MRKYLFSFTFTIVLFVLFSLYLYGRRGFYDLYIINKVFAALATTELGIALLLGPLSRIFDIFDRYLQYRKHFGIAAFIFAFFHTASSLFFLPNRFPFNKYFTTGLWPFVFGLLSFLVLLVLFSISNKWSRDKLNFSRWWFIQNWGVRLAFVALTLHVGIMKIPGWVEWYQKGSGNNLAHPEWPGLGILVGWFMIMVITVRLAEVVNKNLGQYVAVIGSSLLPIIYLLTFFWGWVAFGNRV
ncbi:ferric reductase-like transmembrane domain-containing protein [Candidatus Microgenomates bacterium]|nr:ferric reductase-like transmembrane domain-containing protein [Candidatus Microgenomates bacterium]